MERTAGIVAPKYKNSHRPIPPMEPARRPLPCIHLGKLVERASCWCSRRNFYQCDAGHGKISPALQCETCPDYEADDPAAMSDEPPELHRHLLYHIYPRKGNGVWQRQVDALIPRLPLFTGKKVIAVAVDRTTDDAAAVCERLSPHGCVIEEHKNDVGLREVNTWLPLWSHLQHETGYVYYSHAKGVTRPVNAGVSITDWARIGMEACLDYWPLVETHLKRYPITGPFQKIGKAFGGSQSRWHYSGTFYWLRVEEALPRVEIIDREWWGTESWPGLHWDADEAGCLFFREQAAKLNMYLLSYLRQTVEPAYESWREANQAFHHIPGTVAALDR